MTHRADHSPIKASPCIRNCCLDNDDICMGCYRSMREILIWQAASAEEKQKILRNCAERKQKSVK
ncbi:DUF1289 domain-containing protein [Thalassolituus pacificus]|uniref:DUF1289 domain-containing protein n=1 Tax=Thalassolituus pacificus TaxID=2975440 RepID=A0A9X2WGD5_9GAMM|nr:DUF1289 domain-containing protein [Thalassolituus pacificus]MCT7359850.1 DUF1289 domain-containing protein [Thalassolituus pacificus]